MPPIRLLAVKLNHFFCFLCRFVWRGFASLLPRLGVVAKVLAGCLLLGGELLDTVGASGRL